MPADDIARLLPFLRRYARALTGSQVEGDGAVRIMFEALGQGPLAMAAEIPLKLALFQAFHAAWRKIINGHSIDANPATTPADRRLQRLTPEFRAALLLVLMEGSARRRRRSSCACRLRWRVSASTTPRRSSKACYQPTC